MDRNVDMDMVTGLRDIGMALPPGFRFYPSDEELVCHYLFKKIANEEVVQGTLVDVDLHTCEPWQLPDVAKLNSKEWYFFSFRDRKYATGYRTNRATTSGYWKATGKDRIVLDPITKAVVGMRKTLVFYKSRAPNGIKTGWIMHEFRLENPHVLPKEDWVLCRVFYKPRSENNIEVDQRSDSTSRGACHNSVINTSSLTPYQYQNSNISCTLSSGYQLPHDDEKDDDCHKACRQDSSITIYTSHHNPSNTKYEANDDYGLMFDTDFFDYPNPTINGVPVMRFNEDGDAEVFK